MPPSPPCRRLHMAALKDLGDLEQLGKLCPGLATHGRPGLSHQSPAESHWYCALPGSTRAPAGGKRGLFPSPAVPGVQVSATQAGIMWVKVGGRCLPSSLHSVCSLESGSRRPGRSKRGHGCPLSRSCVSRLALVLFDLVRLAPCRNPRLFQAPKVGGRLESSHCDVQ